MELWIRSQDKNRLTKVDDLYIAHDDNNFCDYIGNNMVGHLAKYTKQGRSLEVLDEIQNKIHPKYFVSTKTLLRPEDIETMELNLNKKYNESFIVGSCNEEIKPLLNDCVLYEMPEE